MFISYNDLMSEQAAPLDYKIKQAVEAVRSGFEASKHNQALAFSGGKDSTVLWHLIREHFPQEAENLHVIFGNTGVEYPESLSFARRIGREWGGDRFHETRPLPLEKDGLKYPAQVEVLKWIAEQGRLSEILKPDGKLKRTDILDDLCPPDMMEDFRRRNLIWKAGTRKSYFWCVDQYGWPLLGKAFSKLKAHRINIDCFLTYSKSKSEKPELAAYYDILREVKISQACCDILKKEPSEKMQADLNIDVIFKGLMAAESRTRQTNFTTRGYLFQSHRDHLPEGDSFYHCNPLSIWTDDDIWEYIHRFHVPYSPLYDREWIGPDGKTRKIPRNGCMACGTDLLFPNNHMATLRRTHPNAWRVFMEKGMAAEIQKLQLAKRDGQYSVLDMVPAEHLIEMTPCAFDRVDRLVLDDALNTESIFVDDMRDDPDLTEYDPEQNDET